MVLVAAIVCALLCALGLNTMLQCVFQCANRVLTEPLQWFTSRRCNSGLKKKEMVALPTSIYNTHSAESTPPSLDSSCAICLAEFCDGDNMKLLPKCNHRFHVVSIDMCPVFANIHYYFDDSARVRRFYIVSKAHEVDSFSIMIARMWDF
ncbi:3-dehydrosphinganine reductase [Trifolium repens]|nr:3-dehydrosphinganine reductase [Trifolium repens]